MENRVYIAIDLKSFYASVECVERGLDPLSTNLVVADTSRTEKTICLAVSPSLKKYGIPGRPRLFEVIAAVKHINASRRTLNEKKAFSGRSYDSGELEADKSLELDYIAAVPHMKKYMEVSTKIFGIYLRFVAPEDIHVYSVDEAFMDVTSYLKTYGMTARELAMKMIRTVLAETGITATAGIGTNLFLCKVAMDVVAKHIPADEYGVRIAELDERSFREKLWDHRPLTDFWRIGSGTAARLEKHGMYTLGDVCRCSLGTENDYFNEELLYRLFGINAELLIDHAWGYEPCTIEMIKKYVPENNSMSIGQVLPSPYDFEHGRLIVREMTDLLVLDMVDKKMVCDQVVLNIGYEAGTILKPAHGSAKLSGYTSSGREIIDAMVALYDSIVDPKNAVRRMSVVCNHVIPESRALEYEKKPVYTLFDDIEKLEAKAKEKKAALKKERDMQLAVLDIKRKFGKNAVLKGMNLSEGGTTIERNQQVGGHKA